MDPHASRPAGLPARTPNSAYAAAIGMTIAFGLSFVATKYALEGFRPMLIAVIRFTVAGGLLWSLWRLRPERERPGRRELLQLAALGFVSLTLYFSLEINGIARTSASAAAILIATIPIFVGVLAAVFLHERNGARQWSGVALSFAGVAGLVVFGAGADGGTLVGDLLVLAAALSAAAYNLMARNLLATRSALYVTAYQNLFGALFMAPLALGEALLFGVRTPTPSAVAGVVYLTLGCSVSAYLMLNYAFRFIPSTRVSVFVNLTPVVGVVAAYAVLGERLGAAQLAAAAVVIAGVWLANSGAAAARSPSAG